MKPLSVIKLANILQKYYGHTMREVPEAVKSLEFRQPFDGKQIEIEDGEKLAAAQAFEQVVEDTMLNRMASVNVVNSTIIGQQVSFAVLGLELPANDNSKLKVKVTTSDLGKSRSAAPCEISLLPIGPDSNVVGTLVHYRLSRDKQQVTREDKDLSSIDVKLLEPTREASHIIEDAPDRNTVAYQALLVGFVAGYKEEMKNKALEREMGFNDQPVGLDEIKKLQELVDTAEKKGDR